MKLNNFRLSTRITVGMLLLVAVAALLWMANENRRLQDAFLNEREADLEAALHVEQVRLGQSIDKLRQDVVFLANTPPISGIVRAAANRGFDPRDNNPYAKWEVRLQEIFSAFLRAHPEYFQVRYIGVADGGRELVRVDNRDGRIEVIPHGALQAKGDQDYFKAGLALSVGRVHLSEFTLNQEFGRIEIPHRPTLRAVTPVFDANGHVFGMVVINQDVRPLLDSAKAGLPPGVQALIADQRGHYLLHPDEQRNFSFELGGKDNISEDFPTLKPLFGQQVPNYLPLHAATEHDGAQYLAAERVYFDASEPSRFLLLAYHIPSDIVAAQMARNSAPRMAGMLLAMLLLAAVLWLILRRVFLPLQQIARSAREIAAGDRMARLPAMAGGEIGELVDALNTMLDKLSDHELIEQENTFRKELIESLPGVFYMIDAQGSFLMWNRNLETVLQLSHAEIAGSDALALFEGDDRVNIGNAIRQVFEVGEVSVEALLRAKDGSKVPYHFTGRRTEREGETVLIGLGLDITEQRENMRVTRLLLRRNQTLMQNSMEGIHVMDIDGNVLDVNEAFCRMLGYTREEAMRLNVRDWDNQFPAEVLRERFRSFIGRSDTFETRHRRRDGSLLDVEICATGVDLDGECYLFASSRDITERKKAQAALHLNKQVVETAMDGFWMTDAQGFLEDANESYASMSGYTMQELVGMHISQLEANEDAQDVKAHIDRIIATGHDRFETRHRRKDGSMFDLEVSATFMPEALKFFVFCHDITRRKQAEQELRVAAATFETHDAILITDAKANILRVNGAFTEITGYRADEVLGKNPRIMGSGRQDHAFYVKMWQQLLHTGSWSGEIWDKRKNGEVYPKWMTISAVKNERQEVAQYVAIFSDITERKRAEEEIHNMAFYDMLTQLPNRRLFVERLRAALPASARRRDYGAVLFLDMDRFKNLNDTLGHEYGDLMLVEVANRIKGCVREMDTVARLGGDEFVVLVEGLSRNVEDASRKIGTVAEKIRETLANPYRIKEHEHHSSPSIGITLFRDNEDTVEALLQHADLAMYQAKKGGRNRVCFFDPVMQGNVERHDALEEELRHAIGRSELCLHYQMQVDRERRPIGAEALLRWQHPQRGLLMPDQILPIAEESALIIEIGRWMLDAAGAQLARWQSDERTRLFTLTVNVGATLFVQPDFVAQVAGVLERHNFTPSRLKLELTESVVSGDLSGTIAIMRALRDLGVVPSIDDFGTVYSSLDYLKQLSSDQLKISGELVQGVTAESGDAQLVEAIVDLAKSMGLEIFAEGVETEAQFNFLKHHDCWAYQGDYFSKPMPLDELETLLDRQPSGSAS